jgi:hypothetical protein
LTLHLLKLYNAGMGILAILTAQTCGEACWHAAEDVCRCSCGGANHGCLRSADGIQPVRSSKINGQMHKLVAVGTEGELTGQANELNKNLMGSKYWYGAATNRTSYLAGPAKLRKATEAQIARWPELAGLRNWKDGVPSWQLWRKAPYLLWLKVDNN